MTRDLGKKGATPPAPDWFEVKAPAKINLCLNVGPRRADGYHPISSLMEEVSLLDTLRARRTGGGGVVIAGTGIPPEENTVMKAARALTSATGVSFNVEFELLKEIPIAAGLGGGSSDAAAALQLLITMFGLDISDDDLLAVALSVGADVPFFLRPGPKLAEGVGELLEDVYTVPDHYIVLVTPDCELSAASVYEKYDDMGGGSEGAFVQRTDWLRDEVLTMDDFQTLSRLLHNDLESAAPELCKDINIVREELRAAGAPGILMSGSGPSVFGLFPEEGRARAAADRLGQAFNRVCVVKPLIHDS